MRIIDAHLAQEIADQEIGGETASLIQYVLSLIPTIEAEPVRHGEWIPYHESDLGWDEYGCRCSECKIEIESKDFWDVFNKRCPNCGARMDGDAK